MSIIHANSMYVLPMIDMSLSIIAQLFYFRKMASFGKKVFVVFLGPAGVLTARTQS